jgi:xylulokinase
MPLFAGLDVSTQSCKLVIIDSKKRTVIYIDSIQYDKDLPEYQTRLGVISGLPEGCSESDPRMWIDAVNRVFENLQSSHVNIEDIRCISVSGQMHGLVALDKDGRLARPRSKLWNDYSTAEECRILTEEVGGKEAMIREISNTQRPGYTAPKILHMKRNEPERYNKTSAFLVVHNYINWYLTGGIKLLEPGDASGTALWNPRTREWSQKVISAIDPCLHKKLPPVCPPDRLIGPVSSYLVEKFGFSPACQIDAGNGDNMYGAVGTGNIFPGMVTVSLGTSGTAATILPEPFIDPAGEIASFCDSTGHYMPLLCVSNLANGYNQFRQQFNLSHEAFTQTVSKTEPANRGRVLIPWYSGERTPDLPQAAPFYFGFKPEDFIPDVICRAVLEGHILNLYEGFRRLPVKASEIRLTGGLSQSEAWVQAIADIFDTETVPVEGEGAALGAALHAAWVWGKDKDAEITLENLVRDFVTTSSARRCAPRRRYREHIQLLRRLFHALSARMRGIECADDPFALHRRLSELE